MFSYFKFEGNFALQNFPDSLSISSSSNHESRENTKYRTINFNNKIKVNDIEFKTFYANTDEDRTLGFSNVEKINLDEAILFIFDPPSMETFWMKDMNFDLYIIWIDENLKIIKIDKNISRNSYNKTNPLLSEKFSSEIPIKYVLEISAGLSSKYKFRSGDKIFLK
jgi:uncharacterized membrane protein (UPF0127 family)